MNLRRGRVFEENPRDGTPLIQVRAHLPVAESFGFVAALHQATSGQAFPQCVFDHWENLQGDALQEGSKLQELIQYAQERISRWRCPSSVTTWTSCEGPAVHEVAESIQRLR